MGEKLMAVDLRLPVGVLDNRRMLSVWLGIHGDLSARQAGHPLFVRRAVALTAGAPLPRCFRLGGRFSAAQLRPAVRQNS
jgi:hypothetical protein